MPQRHMPKVAVVLIGTNDLFAEADCIADNETALEDSVNGIFKRQDLSSVLNACVTACPGSLQPSRSDVALMHHSMPMGALCKPCGQRHSSACPTEPAVSMQ